MPKAKKKGQQKLRVLVDANTLFSSVYYPRFDFEILEHSIRGEIILVLSPYILEQAQEAIIEHIPERLPLFERRLAFLNKEIVKDPTKQEVEQAIEINLVRDPSDIPVALCAINAKVDYLITRDKDFVSENETTREIRKRIRVIKPQVFLERVMNWSKESLEKLSRRRWQDLR